MYYIRILQITMHYYDGYIKKIFVQSYDSYLIELLRILNIFHLPPVGAEGGTKTHHFNVNVHFRRFFLSKWGVFAKKYDKNSCRAKRGH